MKKYIIGLFLILIVTLMVLIFNKILNSDMKEKWEIYNKIIDSNHVEVIIDNVSVLSIDKIDNDNFILNTISSISADSIKSNLERSNVIIRFSENNETLIDAEIYFIKNEEFLTPEDNLVNTLKNAEKVLVIIEYKGIFKTKYMLIEFTDDFIEFLGNTVSGSN